MTTNWRPEDWDMPIVEHLSTGEAFELGADAMLEALRNKGQRMIKGATLVFPFTKQEIYDNGFLVFIPDGEVKQ